jgi:hypothetical protein
MFFFLDEWLSTSIFILNYFHHKYPADCCVCWLKRQIGTQFIGVVPLVQFTVGFPDISRENPWFPDFPDVSEGQTARKCLWCLGQRLAMVGDSWRWLSIMISMFPIFFGIIV